MADLEPDLVAQVFGVGEGCMVEDEDVGEGCAEEVDYRAKEPDIPLATVHGSVGMENLPGY